MTEWKETALSEVIDLIGGGTPKTSIAQYWNGDIPWLSVADFNTGRKYVYDAEKSITQLGFEKSSTKLLQEGDIIISARGTVGVVAMLGRKMAFNQSCYGVRAKEEKSRNYVYYLLKNVVNDLQQISHGGVFDTITCDTFKEIDILLPSLPEQKAIAAVLSILDDKIDLLHRQNNTLEAMAETLFRQWFVEEAQEDWEEGRLGDVIELVYGKGLKKEIRTDTGYPVIGSSGVVGYHSEFLVEGPGIVIGRKGTLGKVIYLWDNFFPIDTTYYIKSKVESAGLLFEYFLLKTLNFEEMNSDSAVPGLNRDIALSTEIKIAPLKKLHKFNQFTSTFIDKLRENTKQIRILEKLRDTLLPKLMSGEVKVVI
jgi:type I restriction enzyme S subunit